jgi:protein TonB
MNTLGLHPVYKPKDPARRFKGIAIVIALHIVIGYGIISGTAHNALVALKKPLEAVVIQEVIIPPPPPPPPKEIKPPEAPKIEAQPPPFVPPPDTPPPPAPPESTAPVIVSTAAPPPAAVVIAPPPQAPPTPQASPKPAPNRLDLRVACPSQVPPEMPRKAIDDGIEGIVKASALIKDGVIKEITILSGPRVFHAAVKAAMKQYKCTAEAGEVVATQEFVFKLE